MLTLYGNLESGNVYKVRLIMALTGVAHRRVEVNQVQGDPRSTEYRAMAPIGKVPAVKFDDGRVMMESGALLYWFSQGTKYFPQDAWDQTQALQWMFFEQYSHEPYVAVARLLRAHATAQTRERRKGEFPLLMERGNAALAVMEQHLAKHDWFAGNRYSIADIALYGYTHCAEEGGFELARYPALTRWLARVAATPGYEAL